MLWWIVVGLVLVASWLLRAELRQRIIAGRKFEGKADLRGKIALVTGANTGIGFETAKYLALHGAHVILACRSREKAIEAVEKIVEALNKAKTQEPKDPQFIEGGAVEFMQLDLSSFASVKKFSKLVLERYSDTGIHFLINNAGLVFTPWSKTEDGFEMQFGTNHLGHFLLTLNILPLLKTAADKSGEARIVVVSSKVHSLAPVTGIDWKLWNDEKVYNRVKQYYISKLANIQFTFELQRRLDKEYNGKGKGVITVNCLHPGSAATDVLKDFPAWFKTIANAWMQVFLKTPEEAAQTTIYCTVSPDLKGKGGRYFRNCAEDKASPISHSEEASLELWNTSLKLVGLEETHNISLFAP